LDNSNGVESSQHEGDIGRSRGGLGKASDFLSDLCSNFVDRGDRGLDGGRGGCLNNLNGGGDLAVGDILELGDVNLVRSVVRHLLDITGGGYCHGNVIAQLLLQNLTGDLEDFNLGRLAGPEENDPLSGLNKLVGDDVTTEGVVHGTFQFVHVDEETVDLDVPGATAVDDYATVSGDLADIVSVEEDVLASPGTEHVFGSLGVAHVVSGGGVGDDTNDTGDASSLGDDVHVFVKDDKVLATLSGIEIDEVGNWLVGADEHLTNTSEANLGAGVVASEGSLGEDLLGQIEVLNAEGLTTDDHPVEAIEGVLGTELHLDIVNKGTEDGGSEVGSEELSVSLVLELSAEGSTLIGDRNGLIQVEGSLVEHETTDLEKGAEESLKEKIRGRIWDGKERRRLTVPPRSH